MAFVIYNVGLTPDSWYGGPVSGWVNNVGSAVVYSTQADAEAVIVLDRMRAIAVANPPGIAGNVVNTGASVNGNVPKYTDATGTAIADSAHAPGTIRQVTVLGVGSGTYTPSKNQGLLMVEVVGGGGGGGGVASPTGTNVAMGAGGGGAGYANKIFVIPGQTFTYTVGAKGAGGAAGNNAGADGSDSSFVGSLGTTVTGSKGFGGSGDAGGAAPRRTAVTASGAGTNGDVNVSGLTSEIAHSPVAAFVIGSRGGGSFLGRGGNPQTVAAANGQSAGANANGKGAGGSGAVASGTGTAAAGGDGTDGTIIVTEYE